MATQLHTEIEIEAPLQRVWEELSDWSAYRQWNPFVVRLEGAQSPGARLGVELRLGAKAISIRPKLVRFEPGHAFAWRGSALVPGLFDGTHSFELYKLEAQRTRLCHFERFSGILVAPVLALIGDKTREAFVAMNEALKIRSEESEG